MFFCITVILLQNFGINCIFYQIIFSQQVIYQKKNIILVLINVRFANLLTLMRKFYLFISQKDFSHSGICQRVGTIMFSISIFKVKHEISFQFFYVLLLSIINNFTNIIRTNKHICQINLDFCMIMQFCFGKKKV